MSVTQRICGYQQKKVLIINQDPYNITDVNLSTQAVSPPSYSKYTKYIVCLIALGIIAFAIIATVNSWVTLDGVKHDET